MKNYHPLLIIGLSFVAVMALRPRIIDDKPIRTTFFDKSGMDTTVLPGNDFFAYANGTWLKNTEIPADWIGWGVYPQLVEGNLLKTKAILEEAVDQTNKPGTVEQLVGDFYASGMDTVTINKRGIEPVQAELAAINAIRTHQQLAEFLVTDESYIRPFSSTGSAFISFYIGADDRQSTITRINFRQCGLSLPEKGYYTRTDSATQKIRARLLDYIAKSFALLGVESATARTKAEAILDFETRLAQSHKVPVDLRDPVTNYHKLAVADLTGQMPNLNWRGLLDRMGLQRVDTVLMAQPAYYRALDSLLLTTPIGLLKDRLTLDLLRYNAALLSSEFEQARFDFYGKTLSGQPKLPDRWKRIARQTDAELGDALGKLWVKRYFPPEAKSRMSTLVNNLQIVYRQRIEKLDWMSSETKATALTKLDRITKKIGYPDQWKNYKGVELRRDDYYGNVQRTRRYWNRLQLAEVNQSVDRLKWSMTPPTVNAYANYMNNEIVFPAGMLQFPYFDKDADDAINYGAIGAVIGHEMTHLFDDQGRKYDTDGNLRDWWTKQDANQFTTKTGVLVDQFSDYIVLDSLHVDGRLTLGENLADLGGLAIAYQAFKLTKQGQSQNKIDGFTPDQRFFLGYAQVWRTKLRPAAERAWIRTNPHSPDKFRVNGPLSNFAPFYRAFNVKPGQKLHKSEADRAKVW